MGHPQSSAPGSGGQFELVERWRVVEVHDEQHALEMLRHRALSAGFGGPNEAELRRMAMAVMRGELVLVRNDAGRPLDPPNPNAVPLLSALDGGDPIAHGPDPGSGAGTAGQTWYEVRLVDGAEAPLVGVDVTISCDGEREQLTTDGDGRVRLDDATARSATISIPTGDGLSSALEAAWTQPTSERPVESGAELDVRHYRDDMIGPVMLSAERPHTISIQPAVVAGKIVDTSFGEGGDFVLPGAVAALQRLWEEHAAEHACVVAHAPQDDLATRRADRLRELLDADVDAWVERFDEATPEDEGWGALEDGHLLRALPDYPSRDPDQDVIEWFQETRDLDVDGIAGPITRGALVTEYFAVAAFPDDANPDTIARTTEEPNAELEVFWFGDAFGVQPPADDPAAYESWNHRVTEVHTTGPTATGAGDQIPILQADDLHFGNERVLFLPEPPRDPAAPAPVDREVTGLSLTRAVLEYANLNPKKQLVFVGHADKLGSKDTNLTVSQDRAENVKLFMLGERKDWAAHCISHYAVDDVQNILIWAAATWSWPTDPGPADNDLGPNTQDGLDAFRVRYNKEFSAGITESGPITEDDFLAFFDLLQATLANMLTARMPELSELQEGIALLDDGIIACGEGWAHEPIVMGGYPTSSQRRVDVLFLDPHEAALARLESKPPLRALYGNPLSKARPVGLWHIDDGAVDTFGYERNDDVIELQFSADPEVRGPLQVRVYEYTSARNPDERRRAIQIDAATLGDEPGLRKSGDFHEVEDGQNLAAIAMLYGASVAELEAHPFNAAVDGQLAAGDLVYVPQVDASKPLALGEVMAAERVGEEDGRPRYVARWSVEETGYDLLHSAQWFPDHDLGDRQGLFATNDADTTRVAPVFPHFAVIDATGRVIAVAPSPAELVGPLEYAEDEAATLVHLDGRVHSFADAGSHEVRLGRGRASAPHQQG